jgi:hypothetical protein
MKFYKYLSIVIATILTATTTHKIGKTSSIIYVMVENGLASLIITSYMIFAIFSCAYSYRLTTRPGMSSQMRQDFISRHMQYVLIYITVWLPYLGLTYYTVYICQIYKQGKINVTTTQ